LNELSIENQNEKERKKVLKSIQIEINGVKKKTMKGNVLGQKI
jgi:hypothetical protein